VFRQASEGGGEIVFRSNTGLRVAALAVVAALLVGACGTGVGTTGPSTAPDASGTATETINIGIGGPFTGTSALTGSEMKNAAEMA
jgi:ABC-type branched-subunit amino acid transport system substrate-binding protein